MIAAGLAFAVLSTTTLQGNAANGDAHYILREFEVPEGTVEISIVYDYDREVDVLDFAVWGPDGFRGYSGGSIRPIVIGTDGSSDGYLTGKIEAGTWTLVIGRAQIKSSDVPWTATIETRDATTLEPEIDATYRATVLRDEPGWYAGDFHVHSRQSPDSGASLEDIIATARDQGLDFVVLSDHNNIKQHGIIADRQTSLDDVLLVRGNEVTTYEGHGNAVGLASHVDFRLGVAGLTGADIVAAIEEGGGTFIVNHPVLNVESCIGCEWELDVDWSAVHGMEVHFGNYDVVVTIFTRNAIELWESLCAQGHTIAAIGGSDDHKGGLGTDRQDSKIGSPTTWVYADSLAEEDIIRGVREGRTLVQLRGPGDPFVDVTIRGADGTDGMLGDTVSGHEVTITARVTGGDGASVSLYADGAVLASEPVVGDDWSFDFVAPVAAEGSRFHIEVGSGFPQVVTSHLYATYADPPAETAGCGCRAGSRSGDGGPLLIAGLGLLLAMSCRQRRTTGGPHSSSRSAPRRPGR